MRSTIPHLAIVFILCILSHKFAFGQNAQSMPGFRTSIQTAQRGIPSAVFEWEPDQLIVRTEGTYNLIGKSPIPFTGLAVGWRTSDSITKPEDFQIEIRTRGTTKNWGVLKTHGETAPSETPSDLYWSHLYETSDGSAHMDYEVRIKAPSHLALRFVRISVSDASTGLKVDRFLGKPAAQMRAEPASTFSQPTIILRGDWWGSLPANEINSPRWAPVAITISHAVIHHTVHANNPVNPAQNVRQIWDHHANNNGWGDIGYNFLVDHLGNIYQGRYNPSLSVTDVRAAHAGGGGGGANAVSFGVALIGQFHPPLLNPPAGTPDSRALHSAENLIAWRFGQRNLDPLSTSNIITYWGTQSLSRITGHRDIGVLGGPTDCPGDNLYNQLATIRTNVKNLLNPTVDITYQTSPPGLQILVDGFVHTTPKTFQWEVGLFHVVTASSPQSGTNGTKYVFSSWNNGQPQTHTIQTPSSNSTYTANYATQYYLTMIAGSGGTVSPASGWCNSGSPVPISATPNSDFSFTDWTGIGTVSYSGPNSSATVMMNGPITETANFTSTLPSCYNLTTIANPSGSGTISILTTQDCQGGYVSGTPINLTAIPGSGYTFNGWAGSGGLFSDATSPTTTFTITGNAIVTAYFIIPSNADFWQPTGSGPSDVYSFVANSQNHIFAATSSNGVFRSLDHGGSWVQINTGLTNTQISSLAINSSGDVFAGTGGDGTFRLTNNGSSWTPVGWPNYIRSLAINSLNHIFAGIDDASILRSTNNGISWDPYGIPFASAPVISLAVNSGGDIFAGTGGDGIFISTDNGVSWSPVNSGLTHKHVRSLAINSDGHIFAGTDDGGVFRSEDNGKNWVPVNNGLTGPNYTVLALAINSEDDIFAGTYFDVFRSKNNGANWISINSGLTNPNNRSLIVDLNGYVFAGSNGGGVFRSVQSTNPCYTLTTGVNTIGWGTVTVMTSTNCSGNFTSGTAINLTATPNSGFTFSGWTGYGGTFAVPSAPITTFTISGHAVVTASFKKTSPTPAWVARYNGPANSADEANALVLDGAGNVYVTGHSLGASSNRDFMTLKYNTAGVRQWGARHSAPVNNLDEAKDIAVDASGNVYVAGFSYGANGNQDYFTIKYNSAGARQWTARYNGPGNGDDKINALAADGAGNVFVTGHSLGANGNPDYATIKYSGAGVLQWVARYNAPANKHDEAKSIVVDGAGNVYVTGNSYGANANHDYFTVKYGSAGAQQWAARYNGPGNGDDKANILTIDGAGSVYVTGHSLGSNGSQDYATIKYNSAGVRQWVARYDAPANSTDEARGIAVDASGNVYVSGYSLGANGNHDFFTVQYNSAGIQQWAARYDGPGHGDDISNALTVDGAGNVYVTGHSLGTNGGVDYATIKYNSSGVRQWVTRYNAPANNFDEARDIALDASGNIFVAGYSLAANGHADFITIKYSASDANANNAQIAEVESEMLEEYETGEQPALEKSIAAPANFVLLQNYPNPFNPTTTIRFDLPIANKVRVAIYSVNGKLVRELMAGDLPAGYHELTFDAGDLACGIYFYRLEAGDFSTTRKMILAK